MGNLCELCQDDGLLDTSNFHQNIRFRKGFVNRANDERQIQNHFYEN